MVDVRGGLIVKVSAHVLYYIENVPLQCLSSFHITTLHTKPIMYTFVYYFYYLFVAMLCSCMSAAAFGSLHPIESALSFWEEKRDT